MYLIKYSLNTNNDAMINKEIKYSPPYNERNLILPTNIEYIPKRCSKKDIRSNKIKIIIAVLSSPHHFKKRYSFRKNYNNRKLERLESKIIFFLSSSPYENIYLLNKELSLYNDIVQFPFQNSYLNLTLLSIMALKYCYRTYRNIKFYIKTDDDMLINYKVLLNVTNSINPNENKVYGHLSRIYKVHRNRHNSNYIPYSQYPYEYISRYVYGGLIIITKKSLKEIYNQTLRNNHYIWREDVNLGVLCNISGSKAVKLPNRVDIKFESKVCIFSNRIIATEIKSFNDNFYCIG